jgi:Carboxypeptidase regulatory-like domain
MRTKSGSVGIVAVVALTLLVALPAFAADVSGVITEASGTPIQGAKVIIQDQKWQPVQTAIAGPKGEYVVKDLAPGQYFFAIEPGSPAFKKGKPAVAFVSDAGLTMDWTVSAAAEPIALVREGAPEAVAAGDPFGLTWPQFALLSATVVGAGTAFGVAGASGAFSGGSSSVASSSK